jgi:hypothetical protein
MISPLSKKTRDRIIYIIEEIKYIPLQYIFEMMLFDLVTFIFILYWPTATLAIECLKCYQDLKLDSSDVLNTARPECSKSYEPGQMCVGTLAMRFEHKNATITFSHLSEEVMILSNGNRIVKNSTKIFFNKDITLHMSQSFCTDSADCVQDINNTYNKSKFDKYKQ